MFAWSAVALPGGGAGGAQEIADLGPGVVLVARLGNGVRQAGPDLAVQAGAQVQLDAGVAEPGLTAQGPQARHGVGEDEGAFLVDAGSRVVSAVRSSHSRIVFETACGW